MKLDLKPPNTQQQENKVPDPAPPHSPHGFVDLFDTLKNQFPFFFFFPI